jgi:hypothetical protein
MEELQQTLSDSPDISVAHREHAQSGEDDNHSLAEFKGCNRAHALDVSGIVNLGMRKFGMH